MGRGLTLAGLLGMSSAVAAVVPCFAVLCCAVLCCMLCCAGADSAGSCCGLDLGQERRGEGELGRVAGWC